MRHNMYQAQIITAIWSSFYSYNMYQAQIITAI